MASACALATSELMVFEKEFHDDHPIGGSAIFATGGSGWATAFDEPVASTIPAIRQPVMTKYVNLLSTAAFIVISLSFLATISIRRLPRR
jgi:hypothetical protein